MGTKSAWKPVFGPTPTAPAERGEEGWFSAKKAQEKRGSRSRRAVGFAPPD